MLGGHVEISMAKFGKLRVWDKIDMKHHHASSYCSLLPHSISKRAFEHFYCCLGMVSAAQRIHTSTYRETDKQREKERKREREREREREIWKIKN